MAAERPIRSRDRLKGTLRSRVTLLSTAAVAAVLVLTGVALVGVQRHQLVAHLDAALRRRADDVISTVANGQKPGTLRDLGGDEDSLAQIVGADGTVIAATHNILGNPPVADAPSAGARDRRETVDGLVIDDDASRLLSRRVETLNGPVVIHVARTLDEVDDSVSTLVRSLALAIPVLLALYAALVWWLVGRTLRPIETIRAEVADIGASDLNRRVPQPPGTDEVARLARTMNAMLDRLEQAADRQQRFVADASHELRNPLTRIRTELEVDLAHPDAADLAATHRSVLEEATNLQFLVEDLLYLASSDAGVPSHRRELVDLDDIVLREARSLRDAGVVQVNLARVSAAQVSGDPIQLAHAVRNLTDNAARHARSTVTVTLVEREHLAVLTVTDDGPGVPPDQRERIFERFARLDDARTRSTGGTGLGLAITRDIIQQHGGTVAIDGDGEGASFIVTLPAQRDR
jgi:signal transduction histidine kinase